MFIEWETGINVTVRSIRCYLVKAAIKCGCGKLPLTNWYHNSPSIILRPLIC